MEFKDVAVFLTILKKCQLILIGLVFNSFWFASNYNSQKKNTKKNLVLSAFTGVPSLRRWKSLHGHPLSVYSFLAKMSLVRTNRSTKPYREQISIGWRKRRFKIVLILRGCCDRVKEHLFGTVSTSPHFC